jgi:NAD(P)-dependent dehydrogenase (short-subunit alcohol dehydrogenase family)
MTLAGRHALVTGGGRGIGRAVARALTAAGATVSVTGRAEGPLKEAVAAGDAAFHAIADVTDAAALRAAIAAAGRALGPVDILVANAGQAASAPFAKGDSAIFRTMFDVNVMGVVHAGQAVLPGMVERGWGRIINIASIAGLKGMGYVTAYCAAKHAVVGLTRALAHEVAAKGVTVNAVCPGYVETDMVAVGLDAITAKTGRPREEGLAAMIKDNPQKRLIRAEEVAAACLWLASDGAAAVNGAAIPITGGEI